MSSSSPSPPQAHALRPLERRKVCLGRATDRHTGCLDRATDRHTGFLLRVLDLHPASPPITP